MPHHRPQKDADASVRPALSGFGHMLHHAAADRIIAAVDELIGRA
jgi:hypothetical protein